jgi:hypothetical protein
VREELLLNRKPLKKSGGEIGDAETYDLLNGINIHTSSRSVGA